MIEVFDRSGQPIRLGSEIGRGGEGAVFEVLAHPNLVAKLYHQPIDRGRASKISWMSGVRNDRLNGLTAWPIDLLLKRGGEALGFLMPRVAGYKDIHRLYSPKSRERDFPKADWRFLLHAAANTARAFAVIHETGCVIGDVNHGSVLVADNATVRVIDCDSFQVTANGHTYLCEVGVEDFTPPELQNRSLAGIVRQPNHDNFGLAVLIFRLLFMGKHPFAGRFLGTGQMPLSKAISQFRFVYGSRQVAIQMERPPGAPGLDIVGNVVGSLFEQAFAREMISSGRPSGREWGGALSEVEKQTIQCRMNEAHWYLRSLASCPWCAMEAATGATLFGFVPHPAPTGGMNLISFWQQVLAVQQPGPLPPLNQPVVRPSAAAIALGRKARIRHYAGPVGAISAVVLGLFVLPLPDLWFVLIGMGFGGYHLARMLVSESGELDKLKQRRDQAQSRWNNMQRTWNERAGTGAFEAKLHQLEHLKQELSGIPALRLRKLDQLKSQQRALQLARYLDNFEIETATIPGVGPGRKQTLELYGIETAADITPAKVAAVPGFGPVLSKNLQRWRKSLES